MPESGMGDGGAGGDPATLTEALRRIRELEAQLDKALFDAGNLRLQLDMFSVTDSLTGLRNVNGVMTALDRAAARARRSAESFALMTVDFPALVVIAQRFGSSGVEDAVRHIGALISACLRRLDTVGRVDELGFHVVLPMVEAAAVDPVVTRISALLERMPMDFDGETVALDPVFTIVLSNPHGTNDTQHLMRELAAARDRQPEQTPLVIRSKTVVEQQYPEG